MASACRSVVRVGTRSLAGRASLFPKPLSPISVRASPFSSPTRAIPCAASRVASVLGSVESMLPLHSAVASARLKSSLALDSTCWSWLAQGLAVPL